MSTYEKFNDSIEGSGVSCGGFSMLSFRFGGEKIISFSSSTGASVTAFFAVFRVAVFFCDDVSVSLASDWAESDWPPLFCLIRLDRRGVETGSFGFISRTGVLKTLFTNNQIRCTVWFSTVKMWLLKGRINISKIIVQNSVLPWDGFVMT